MFGDKSDPKYQPGEPVRPESIPEGVVISEDTRRENRIPPGQTRTRKWPVLDAFGPPRISTDKWRLDVFGEVDNPVSYSWTEFRNLPRVKVFADFHCVTRWSRLSNIWEGVSIRYLLEQTQARANVKFVVLHGYDNNWSTNLPFADFAQDDVLVADTHDGESISLEHGGPVRMIVPKLYAWKSAKWLRGIELVTEDKPGYWERGGYHLHGDPWIINAKNPDGERFREDWR